MKRFQNQKKRGKYYLAHHPVIREDKDTTKLRIVFDPSAKTLGPRTNAYKKVHNLIHWLSIFCYDSELKLLHLLLVEVVGKWRFLATRPQVSRQIPRVDFKWVGRYLLSTVTLGHPYPFSRLSIQCTSPAKRSPPKTVNEKKFLSTQSLTFISAWKQSDYSMVL